MPLGYCNVGVVVALGEGVSGFSLGDKVVSNGSHAEIVAVNKNLCSKVPANVDDESASFTVLASIGLQGIRLAKPTLGESFLVSGLGLIGLLTAQLLVAHGCRVLGLDPDPSKCSLARELGISAFCPSNSSDPVAWCLEETDGVGVDGCLITAATSSAEPLHLAAKVCRKRGRIVLVGVTGLELRRDLFYKKELSFQVSCSYGPGRYDPEYEDQGHDYPIGFVRWTEQRNFQAVLHALATGSLSTDALILTSRLIRLLPTGLGSPEPSGILLQYSGTADSQQRTVASTDGPAAGTVLSCGSTASGVIGAGSYTSRIRPCFQQSWCSLHNRCIVGSAQRT